MLGCAPLSLLRLLELGSVCSTVKESSRVYVFVFLSCKLAFSKFLLKGLQNLPVFYVVRQNSFNVV